MGKLSRGRFWLFDDAPPPLAGAGAELVESAMTAATPMGKVVQLTRVRKRAQSDTTRRRKLQ
jgi:hypothetical protein